VIGVLSSIPLAVALSADFLISQETRMAL